jgi:hypothetical protein
MTVARTGLRTVLMVAEGAHRGLLRTYCFLTLSVLVLVHNSRAIRLPHAIYAVNAFWGQQIEKGRSSLPSPESENSDSCI